MDNPRQEPEIDQIESMEFSTSEEELPIEKQQSAVDVCKKESNEVVKTEPQTQTVDTKNVQNGFVAHSKPRNNKVKGSQKETYEMKKKPIKRVKR